MRTVINVLILYRVSSCTAPLFPTTPTRCLFTINKCQWKSSFIIKLLQNLEASLVPLLQNLLEFAILESTVLCSANVRRRYVVQYGIQRTS